MSKRMLLCAALVALAACGDRTRLGPKPAWLAAAAAPVRLDVALDRAHAVTKTIGRGGGSLSTSGADGTYFTLRIPKGALLSDARITMTPVRQVGGLPLGGGTVAAVQLEPDGLRLLDLATLTIDAQAEVPAAEQVSYAYFGGGEDAHLFPLGRDPKQVELRLAHFSGYGYGRAAPNDPGRLALQRAADVEARLSAQVAQRINELRQKELLGTKQDSDPGLGDVVEGPFAEYYEQVLRPLLKTAVSDDRMAECALVRYLAWMRQLQLLGLVDSGDKHGAGKGAATTLDAQADEGWDLASKAFTNALEKRRDRAVKQCKDQHDLSAVGELVALERTAQLLGAADESSSRVFELMEECLNFELEFSSRWQTTGPNGLKMAYDVRSRVEVDGSPPAGKELVLGQAPLAYAELVATGDPAKALVPKEIPMSKSLGDAMLRTLREGGSSQLSAVGSIPGEVAVYSIELAKNFIEKPGTDCSGQDDMQKGDSISVESVVIGIRHPAEVVRSVAKGYTSVDTSYDWVRQWAHRHGEDQVAAPPGASVSKDQYGETRTSFYKIPLKPTGAGIWSAEYTYNDVTLGWGGAERSRVVLRHAPR